MAKQILSEQGMTAPSEEKARLAQSHDINSVCYKIGPLHPESTSAGYNKTMFPQQSHSFSKL